MKKFVISARPKQILKNFVIFIPLIFTLDQWSINELSSILANSFLCFLALSSASIIGYQANDLIDKKFDKKHPSKKLRPIANNEISNREIFIFITIFLILGIIFSLIVNFYILILFFSYITLSFLYSYQLKNLIILDSISITIFYIIRMIAGAYSITLSISIWLYILTFLSTLFIILIKRISESKSGDFRNKNIVSFYKEISNSKVVTLLLINIFSYSIYSISEILSLERNITFGLTIIFFSMGIIRYFAVTKNSTLGESPESIILSDKIIQFSVFLYVISVFISEIF
jgi:4-hydroxybenzoate polyprenyltransferase|tara:strand:- start:5423 stop:6286 length:864 start_codon:yes stop_codon:yes gene_type:complete